MLNNVKVNMVVNGYKLNRKQIDKLYSEKMLIIFIPSRAKKDKETPLLIQIGEGIARRIYLSLKNNIPYIEYDSKYDK